VINIIFDDLSKETNGCDLGGGYGRGDTIYIDYNLPPEKLNLYVVHEILDLRLNGDKKKRLVKHSKIDRLAIEILEALQSI